MRGVDFTGLKDRTAGFRAKAHTLFGSPVTTGILIVLLVIITVLTINVLDQGKEITKIQNVVEVQEVIVRAQCSKISPTRDGCQALLDRLIENASKEQLRELGGRRGRTGARGPAGSTGATGSTGARGATGRPGQSGKPAK